jgi:hypothetical protein
MRDNVKGSVVKWIGEELIKVFRNLQSIVLLLLLLTTHTELTTINVFGFISTVMIGRMTHPQDARDCIMTMGGDFFTQRHGEIENRGRFLSVPLCLCVKY